MNLTPMHSADRLTAVVMALAAGAVFAVFAPWLTGLGMGVAWPEWWGEWARSQPALALGVWNALLVGFCWLVPAALLAWLVVRAGRLPDWRYTWLAPLPIMAWTLLLPALEGQDLYLAERFARAPLRAAGEAVAFYLAIPAFAWLLRRRPAPRPSRQP